VFRFKQAVPISSYLLALAVGNLVQRELGPISAVWSEPEMVEAGAYEFAGGRGGGRAQLQPNSSLATSGADGRCTGSGRMGPGWQHQQQQQQQQQQEVAWGGLVWTSVTRAASVVVPRPIAATAALKPPETQRPVTCSCCATQVVAPPGPSQHASPSLHNPSPCTCRDL
jgi:hypothetical protein